MVLHDAYLSALYSLAYNRIRRLLTNTNERRSVEIGAGHGLAAHFGHHWLTTDVANTAELSVVNDARSLPFRSGALDALVMKDAWHHLPDIEAFLAEAHRVLRPGGVISVFDPYWGLLARFVYRFLHQERWDTATPDWSFSSSDPWDSNSALSYLMLQRDRAEFLERWGDRFALVECGAVVGPSFLLSGGVSRRTPISGRALAALLRWEESRGPWFDHLRFFHVFRLIKR